jgi:hypothetical protein
MPFQTVVNQTPAPAVAGDFASANPRSSVLAGPGALVSGTGGLTVGRFGWMDATQTYVLNAGSGAPSGFFARQGQMAIITTYLAEGSNIIPQGWEVTLYGLGDFWVQVNNTFTVGQKVFANNTDGSVKTGAAGATVAGHTETKWTIQTAGASGELGKMSFPSLLG